MVKNHHLMPVQTQAYNQLSGLFKSQRVTLVAVSKTKPVGDIEEMFSMTIDSMKFLSLIYKYKKI